MSKKITELTELTAIATNDLFIVEDVSTSTTKKITWDNLVEEQSVVWGKLAPGIPVQVVSSSTTAAATGTTTTPLDDTIPQNTEGTEFLSLAITPKATSHILVIDVTLVVASGTADRRAIAALHQDSTADALAAVVNYYGTADSEATIKLTHRMAAGTTSATTFKVRIGPNAAATLTFNGRAGARLFGAITKSSIVITEYKA